MATIKIGGMTCQHCVANVTKVLNGVEGVTNARVDLGAGEAAFDEDKPVDMAKVRELIHKAGYEVVP